MAILLGNQLSGLLGDPNFTPRTGYSEIVFSADEVNLPPESVFFQSGIGFLAGDSFHWPTTSDTGHDLVLDSLGVPQQFIPTGSHNYVNSYFVEAVTEKHTTDQTLTVVIANNVPNQFTFTDILSGTASTVYQDVKDVIGPDNGAMLYITNGEISNDGGVFYTRSPVPMVTGQTKVRSEVTTGASDGDYSQSVAINGVSDTFTVTVSGQVTSVPVKINNLLIQGIL